MLIQDRHPSLTSFVSLGHTSDNHLQSDDSHFQPGADVRTDCFQNEGEADPQLNSHPCGCGRSWRSWCTPPVSRLCWPKILSTIVIVPSFMARSHRAFYAA